MASEAWIRTTCPYCGVGCGVLARASPDGTAEIKGDPEHPANRGRLCSKGSALGETLSLDDRLLAPIVDGAPASWDAALDLVARRFSETIAAHGPDSVALYVSGQLLTEDYYVANKLMKGFVGSANIDTNSRLCMSSSVAGHKRAFGSDTVPGVYEDLELADLVVLVGSNLAWCHPVLFQRLAEARERRGTKVVVIDPRVTATSDIADIHLAVAPGSDVALFNGLLAGLAAAGRIDQDYVSRYTSGLDAALATARTTGLGDISEITGLSVARLAEFFDLFAATERVVTVYSQGVNQSIAGTDKVNAIINCHLATGRIGRPGMGPFSVTGQPNAMGGREAGGLANMLTAHMELDDPRHRQLVRRYWSAPRIADRAGLKAVDLFRAIGDGRIKAAWIVATNPVVSLPEADRVRAALAECPFVVVTDVTRHTDTTALADVLLPAAAWGEKDGTVTNSERRISRQRAFLPVPGEARPDWWQIAEVARRMGYADAFGYAGPCDIFAEYAGLTGIGNGGTRDLDISALADITRETYAGLEPFQWPRSSSAAGPAERRFFGEGGFFTPDRRARFIATPYRPPAHRPTPPFSLVLSTGRIRDQWHTMTRTGKSARLMAHIGEPFLAIHPDDARRIGVEGAELAEVESTHGRAVLRVVVTAAQRRGSVFAPMHWSDQLASRARVGAVVNADADLVSGQPEMKHTPVDVRRLPAAWYGFMLSLTRPQVVGHAYAAIAPVGGGWRAELAGMSEPACREAHARMLLGIGEGSTAAIVAYHDAASGQYRYAAFDEECRLVGALYLAREPVAVSRGWLGERLGTIVAPEARLAMLAGRPGPGVRERGAIVCACFEVGAKEIVEAVVDGGCQSVAAVGALLQAGTNCGSCRAEIGRIVAQACPRPADRLVLRH